ncbi:putative heat shock protein 70 family protein [Tanacetum coccineum]
MIKDFEMYKYEDQEFKNRADAYNALQDRLDEIDDNKVKKKVHTQSLKKIENAVADTTEWLHNNDDASVNDLKATYAFRLMDFVYGLTLDQRHNHAPRKWIGRLGISSLMKCTSTIRQMAYGAIPDALDEYLQQPVRVSKCFVRPSWSCMVKSFYESRHILT